MSEGQVKRGCSQLKDPRQAVEELYKALQQDSMALVVLFCSPEFDLQQLAAAIKKVFGDTPVIGCTTAGEIAPNGFLVGSISGFSLGASDFTVGLQLFEGLKGFSIADGKQLTSATLDALTREVDQGEVTSENSFGFLLVDGGSIREESVISGIYTGINGLSVFGGSAGDGLNFGKTYVYCDGEFRNDSAVLGIIHSKRPFKVVKTQHFSETEKKLIVTEAVPEERRVVEFNGEPAADEYARLIGIERSQLTPTDFAENPVVLKVGGNCYERSISQVMDDSSMVFLCAIDEGIVLTIAGGHDIIENMQQTLDSVKSELGVIDLVIGCDCILRRIELENKALLEQMGEVMSKFNVIGFSTYGEQYDAMHINQTFTGVAIGEQLGK